MKLLFRRKEDAFMSLEAIEQLMKGCIAQCDMELYLEKGDLDGNARVEYVFEEGK